MPTLSLEQFPEVFISNTKLALFISHELKRGKIRKLASKLYTKNLIEKPEIIIRRNLWPIIAAYFPGALIADRTAIENAPSKDGSVFIVSSKKRAVKLPGITVYPRKGANPLPSDKPFIGGLYLSSMPRAYLENMRPSRARKGNVSRTLSKREIEERLDGLLATGETSPLLRLRDEMRQIAPILQLEKEFEEIDAIIGNFLGTRQADLVSDAGRARAVSVPYDSKRLPLFEELFRTLLQTSPIIRTWKQNQNWSNFLFFESYFSNYIEGTEFELNEAHQIIFEQKIPQNRPQDAHDILGTYQILSNQSEIGHIPKSFAEFENLLKNRHAIMVRP
jgi:hypothetical protein